MGVAIHIFHSWNVLEVLWIDLFKFLRVESLSKMVELIANIEGVLASDIVHLNRLLILTVVIGKHVIDIEVTNLIPVKLLQRIFDDSYIAHHLGSVLY